MKVITKFEITYNQFLGPDGKVIQPLPAFATTDNLIKLYRFMTLLRIFDTKAVALQRTGKMGTYAGILGQEAISVAIGAAMRPEDVLCPAYREYGAMLQRGVKMSEIFAFWGGDERGNHYLDNQEDFPICVPIAGQCLHAAGVATAFKLRKQKRVAVTVCGDGGTSKGDFYEAVNLAGDWNLPMVFVVNNNQWAISVPRKAQTHAYTLAQKAIAGGFNGIQVDGNDVIAIKDAIEQALDKARAGDGPTLVEAITYRLCDHTTADHAKRYRSDEEVEAAWKIEPLIRLRTYLTELKVWSADAEEKLQTECTAEVEKEMNKYLETPPPPPESMFDSMYAKLPKNLEIQRQILLEEEADHA